MRLFLLAAALFIGTLAAVATLRPHPAQAYGDKPWCAVVTAGPQGVLWECNYWRVEDCARYVVAGNRGQCTPNPSYRGPIPGLETPYHRHHRHRR
jgi:Protein of unknown function (DUF3551)